VLGLGPTKVLVLDSALLHHHPPGEVAQTVAHELKHYVRGDDLQALYAVVALTLGALAALYLGSGFVLSRWSGRLGVASLGDPASLPLVVLILTVFWLAGAAAFHAYGRPIEEEADRFALDLTSDAEAHASLMQRFLACSRLKDPDTTWVQQTFQRHHASFRSRIELARDHVVRGHGAR
jgi:STE24 endopeptidase